MEAEEDKKLTSTLTIFTFPSVFTNEGDEDLPKSGIRSPGRGEEELGSVQITQEMVNKSLGELKLTQSIREQMATCVRGIYRAGEAMTGQDSSPVHSLETGETGTRELQSRWTFTPETSAIAQRPHYSDSSLLAMLQTAGWIISAA